MLMVPLKNQERTHKGESLLTCEASYVAIDLETTGLDSHFDEIIEIAAVCMQDGQEIDRFQTLVKPSYEISDFITDLTGITNDMLADAPNIRDVLPQFLTFVGDNVLVAHNANFDINFLYDNAQECLDMPLTNNFLDTMRLSRWLYRDLPNHKLQTILDYLNITNETAHRALSDATCTAISYEHMKSHVQENQIDLSTFRKGGVRSSDIKADGSEFDDTHILYNKVCVFTGALERMLRRDAMQLVADIGGVCGDGVTKKTNFLILGNNDYCATIKDGKSSKQKKAEKLKLEGQDIEIISENTFYDMF